MEEPGLPNSIIMTPINYIALLGERDSMPYINIPPYSLRHPMLRYLAYLPQNLSQLVYAEDYYILSQKERLQLGYKVGFIHPDTVELLCSVPLPQDRLNVLLICTSESKLVTTYRSCIERLQAENVLTVLWNGAQKEWQLPGHVVDTEEDLWRWLYEYAQRHCSADQNRLPYSVSTLVNKELINRMECSFAPTWVNRRTLMSMIGNWGYSWAGRGIKSSEADSHEAIARNDSFERQKRLVAQIRCIDIYESLVSKAVEQIDSTEEAYRAPLVIAAPYTSYEMRNPIQRGTLANDMLEEGLMLALNTDYTTNYVLLPKVESMGAKIAFDMVQRTMLQPRMAFYDWVGMLHCSIRFSPYLRIPTTGKNLSAELSCVDVKNSTGLVLSRNANRKVRKVMEKVGKKMSELTLSKEAERLINSRSAQIVAMTDLPIEWMMVDGIPIGFTHDVCRLPETPIVSYLSQYESCQFRPYSIPEDIIKKTLVIYGNEDVTFVQAREYVEILKGKLGFETRLCTSVEAYKQALEELKPELLIVDTHGGYDEKSRQTYLMMGDEKLTGMDVVKGESPRLVFLSACNTCPTYNTVSTIANAYFEAGAAAVTTSYMPVQVKEATTLYTRLLNQLAMASTQALHSNWLSFVAHIQRTSYILEMVEVFEKNVPAAKNKYFEEVVMTSTDSMDFRKRRAVYRKLNSKELAKRVGLDYDTVIPHYLMYSTLGRADLIRFESYKNIGQ